MASAIASRLHGKTIVITGASSGIGRSTAIELAKTSPHSLNLVLAARRIDKLTQVAEDITNSVGNGVKILPCQLDVRRSEDVRKFFKDLPAPFRDVDVLVNNA